MFDWLAKISDHGFPVSRAKATDKAQLIANIKRRKQVKCPVKISCCWWFGFKRRFLKIVRRKTQDLEQLSSYSCNSNKFEQFFRIYKELLDKYVFIASRIFNMDEKGVILDQPPRYKFTKKGSKIFILEEVEIVH